MRVCMCSPIYCFACTIIGKLKHEHTVLSRRSKGSCICTCIYIHTHMHSYVHACMHASKHTFTHTHMHVQIGPKLKICSKVRALTLDLVELHTYIHTCARTKKHTHTHKYKDSPKPHGVKAFAVVPNHTHTHTHTHNLSNSMHTCTHTHTYACAYASKAQGVQALTVDPVELLVAQQDAPPALHTIEIEGVCVCASSCSRLSAKYIFSWLFRDEFGCKASFREKWACVPRIDTYRCTTTDLKVFTLDTVCGASRGFLATELTQGPARLVSSLRRSNYRRCRIAEAFWLLLKRRRGLGMHALHATRHFDRPRITRSPHATAGPGPPRISQLIDRADTVINANSSSDISGQYS